MYLFLCNPTVPQPSVPSPQLVDSLSSTLLLSFIVSNRRNRGKNKHEKNASFSAFEQNMQARLRKLLHREVQSTGAEDGAGGVHGHPQRARGGVSGRCRPPFDLLFDRVNLANVASAARQPGSRKPVSLALLCVCHARMANEQVAGALAGTFWGFLLPVASRASAHAHETSTVECGGALK